jgi:hypothetical protein
VEFAYSDSVMLKPFAIIATIGLVLVGSAIALVGLLASTQAAIGTSLVGFACFLGIVARIFQAAYLAMPETEAQLQSREQVAPSMSRLTIAP